MKRTILLCLTLCPLFSFAQWTTPDANKTIYSPGKVGIAVTDTKGYALAVGGNVVAEEVVVKLKQNWPDFVFAPTYELADLEELERFIKCYRHLPGIPDATEVAANGVSIGSISASLLTKIEELTLHLIRERKYVQDLEARIAKLEEEIKKMD